MTGPVITEALVESLASEIADILLDGGALSPKDFAQRLAAGPALQQVTVERDEYAEYVIDLECQATRDKAEIARLRIACVAIQKSIARFPGSVHDRAMAKIDKALGVVPPDFVDPDEIELARLRAEGEALREDAARLDFLDGCNARLNASYGTHYGWKLVLNHNVNRLVLGDMKVDLHDSEGGNDKLPSCRLAIDEARKRTALARAATAREG